MPLIERYVLRRASYVFMLALGALVGVLWVTQVLRQLDFVTAKGQGIWVFFLMTLMTIPAIVEVIAPIAFLAAAIVTLNAMTNDSELPVIAAAGASRTSVNRPILMLGLFVALGVALCLHVLSPAGLAIVRELMTRAQAEVIATLVQDGGFRTVDRNLTMHIREKAPDGSFRDIFVSDERNPGESVQYSAARGMLLQRDGGHYLILQDGDLIRQDRTNRETNVIDFETYALDLSQLGSPNATAVYKARERSTLYLLDPDAGDSTIESSSQRVLFELHSRISEPLYAIAFALIVLAFLGRPRTSRQDRTFAISICVLICALLRTAGFAAAAVSRNSMAGIPFLYAIPVAGILFGALATLSDARLAMPRPVETFFDWILTLLRRSGLWRLARAASLRGAS
jgi:lipopolysaccharide export system permease protein